jgi:hypothetical protein
VVLLLLLLSPLPPLLLLVEDCSELLSERLLDVGFLTVTFVPTRITSAIGSVVILLDSLSRSLTLPLCKVSLTMIVRTPLRPSVSTLVVPLARASEFLRITE